MPCPASNPPLRETLGKHQRLRQAQLFQDAYEQNRRWHGRHMVLFLRSHPDSCRRLGVVASRKIGNAVERNRAKRRLREVFRRHRPALQGENADFILVAKRSLLRAPWKEIVADFLQLARQAGFTFRPRP